MRNVSICVGAVLALASSVAAFGPPPPQPDGGGPQTTIAKDFVWRNPFKAANISDFDATCDVSKTFPAAEYTLHSLLEPQPKGLGPWSEGLKSFFKDREYPGSWAGIDRHLNARRILMMEYDDIPVKVREWIEGEDRTDGEGKGLYAVFAKPKEEGDTVEEISKPPASAAEADRSTDKDKVAIFAPGALYSVLPLWVAEGSSCEDVLLDLTKYSPQPQDASVVAWPVEHKTPDDKAGERAMSFTIKAQLLKQVKKAETESEAPEPEATASVKDEL